LDYKYIIVPVNENSHWYVAIIYNAHALLPSSSAPSVHEGEVEEYVSVDVPNDGHTSPVADLQPSSSSLIGQTNEQESQIDNDNADVTTSVQLDLSASTDVKRSTYSKKGKRKSIPVQRKVDLEAPRIILLDSLGLTHSPTASNLRTYLVAEIKSKLNIEIEPPRALGLTAKQLPQQNNYCDCGPFLLLYIEMFLEKGDEFIRNLLQGSLHSELKWKDASHLRASMRDLLFELQKEQAELNLHAKKERLAKKKATKVSDVRSSPETNSNSAGKEAKDKTSLVTNEQMIPAQKQAGSTTSSPSNLKKSVSTIAGQGNSSDVDNAQIDASIDSNSKATKRQGNQPIILEIEDSQDGIEPLEKKRPRTLVASTEDQQTQRLKTFGSSFGPKIESPRGDELPSSPIHSTRLDRNNLNDYQKSSPSTPRLQGRQGTTYDVVEINDSPEQLNLSADMRKSIESTPKNGPRSMAPSNGMVEMAPVDILTTVDVDQTNSQTAMQQVDDAEMLMEPVDERNELLGGRSQPINVPDSPPSSRKEARSRDVNIEIQGGRHTRKESKVNGSHNEYKRSSASSSNQRFSASSPTQSRKRKSTSDDGVLILDPLDAAMLKPREIQRGHQIKRTHLHYKE